MERSVIEEPQLSYLLELITELGSAADDFVLAGAQAIKFTVPSPRNTRDFDFVLDVTSLKESPKLLTDVLGKLHYIVDQKARNFQFEKQIPNSKELMRIEFLASDEKRRRNDIRVDVQKGVHARACTGADIALRESDPTIIKGKLPNGSRAEVKLRIIRPSALLILKCFAMDDRYRNIRGPDEAEHDRDEARTHAADIVSIVRHNIQKADFIKLFWAQFSKEVDLKNRSSDIISEYFADLSAPGIQLYAEYLLRTHGNTDNIELEKALREIRLLISKNEGG